MAGVVAWGTGSGQLAGFTVSSRRSWWAHSRYDPEGALIGLTVGPSFGSYYRGNIGTGLAFTAGRGAFGVATLLGLWVNDF